jgi:hypothetical protein
MKILLIEIFIVRMLVKQANWQRLVGARPLFVLKKNTQTLHFLTNII